MMITQRRKEKKKAGFRVSFIFLFIFASFAVCFVLYMKEDFEITEEMLEDTADAVVYIDPVGQSGDVVNPVPQSARRDESYYADAVFIGSRSLAGLADYGYTKSENMMISDSITISNFDSVILSADGVESSIADAVIRKNAGKIYIMAGIESLGVGESPNLLDGLETFIGDVSERNPDTEIYLMSLFPVPAEKESGIALNTDIDAYNSRLLKFADKMNVRYLDVNTYLKGNDGKLPPSAAEANGIRLKKEMYGELSEYILTHTAE